MKKVLYVDPSSTRTGWAVMSGTRVFAFGAINAKRGRGLEARLRDMAVALRDVVIDHGAAEAVVEIPSGKVNHSRNGGGGSGLSVYGFAAGYLYCALEADALIVRGVTAEEWTRGITKEKRKRIAAKYAEDYAGVSDSGGDIADAIALGVWDSKKNKNYS